MAKFDAGTHQLIEAGTVSGGTREGLWKFYEPGNGRVTHRRFMAGREHGKREYFQGSRCIGWAHWDNGKPHGKSVVFGETKFSLVAESVMRNYPTERIRIETHYDRGVLSGPYMELVGSSLLVIGQYSRGLRQGSWEYYDMDRSVIRKECYRHGELHGPMMKSAGVNEVIVGLMRANKRVGKFDRIYRDTGKVNFSTVYREGLECFFIQYSPDGSLVEIGESQNGEKHGDAVTINSNHAVGSRVYDKGRCISTSLFITREFKRVVFYLSVRFNLHVYF